MESAAGSQPPTGGGSGLGATIGKRASVRRSLTTTLPPLGSAAAAAAMSSSSLAGNAPTAAAASPAPASSSASAVAAAVAYKSAPSELVSSLRRDPASATADRSGVAEKRRLQRVSLEAKAQREAAADAINQQLHPTMAGAAHTSSLSRTASVTSIANASPPTLSMEADESEAKSNHPHATGPKPLFRPNSGGVTTLRIPTPLPNVRTGLNGLRPSTREGAGGLPSSSDGGIDLLLPVGSQSARNASTAGGAAHSSSLAAITQDTNARLASFLRHYDGHRRESSSSRPMEPASTSKGAGKSHRLLLGHMTHLSAKQLEEEKEISRLLTSWHPLKSAKSFASTSAKIRAIISERVSLFEGHFAGKALVEEAGFVPEEIEKKRSALYKLFVPSNIGVVKLELDVTAGRLEVNVNPGEPTMGGVSGAGGATGHGPSSSSGGSGGPGSSGQQKAWSLRAGVGHHSLTMHSSDPNFRAGETFYITLYALQTTSLLIKASLGGKTKSSANSSTNNNSSSSAAAAGGLDELMGGPASSGTRLTARQSAQTRHAPSTRNLRATLEARVKQLQANPKMLKEFMSQVKKLRQSGVRGQGDKGDASSGGGDGSRSKHAPAHLSDRALHNLNAKAEREEAAAAAAAAATSPEGHSGSAVNSPRGFHRSGVAHSSLAAGPRHSYPLTTWSLDYLPHIHALPGVAETFYQCVRELPGVLDEEDCLIWDRAGMAMEEEEAAAAEGGGRIGSRGSTRAAGDSSTAHSPLTSPRSRSREKEPLSAPRQSPPTLERRSSLGTTIETLLPRVLSRLHHRSSALARHGSPEAREESHWLARCANIYAAHRSEIGLLLTAFALGDPSNPLHQRYLVPLPGRNFLLSNAFDATENRTYAPDEAEKRRRKWKEEHRAKMELAEMKRVKVAQEKKEATIAVLERKERERATALADRAAAAEKLALQELQRLWLRHLAATLRHRWVLHARGKLHPMRVEAFRKNRAARRIQLFVRASLAIKRKTRASFHFQAFRSAVLLMAHNYSVVKRDRAANCIKLFIEQKQGVDSVSRLIKNFRRRVGVCQRTFRRWIATRQAKMRVWRLQFTRAITHAFADGSNQALLEDTHSRDRILDDLFSYFKREAVRKADGYAQEASQYIVILETESAKKRIITDHVMELPPYPLRPKIPIRLHEETIAQLLDQALQASKEQALRNLQSSTEFQETSPSNASEHAGGLAAPKKPAGSQPGSRRGKRPDMLESPATPQRGKSRSSSRSASRRSSMTEPIVVKIG